MGIPKNMQLSRIMYNTIYDIRFYRSTKKIIMTQVIIIGQPAARHLPAQEVTVV
jgi:hypothetical protein